MNTRRSLQYVPAWVLSLALVTTFIAGAASADPPVRIGRLSYFSGTVSFSPAGDDLWVNAVRNRPVITGDRLWSDDAGRVELTLDNGALWLGPATSVVISNIDDNTAQFEVQQGTVELRVRRMSGRDVVEIDTPNLALQIVRPGRYRIAVDPQAGTTTVVVRNGSAEVYGDGVSYAVTSGQAYRFYGTDLRDNEYFTPAGMDYFERFVRERDARFDRLVSARYVSPEVVGYEDLDRYGSWRPVESYGHVWFPENMPSDWAPYRRGHWSWIDPWGWTWVDDAPWGFAPFHYGRWAYVESRWGWVPGPVNVRPVYAPALVAFVGGANFSVSAASGPAIGWFPLAPREVYRPAYNVSREYYRQVNVSNTVINNTVINNTYVANVTNTIAPVAQQANYVNLRAPNAVTAVPHAAFAQSQSVRAAAIPLPSATLNRAQVQSMAPIAPARSAFVGGARPARAQPPAAVQQQGVVARSPPPAAPIPLVQRLPALERNPGRPLDRAEMQATGTPESVTAPRRNIKIVSPDRATAPVSPPRTQGDALRGRGPQPGEVPPSTAVPTAPSAGTATTPAPQSETRRQSPASPTPPPAPAASERPERASDPRGAPSSQPPRSEGYRQQVPAAAAPGPAGPPRQSRGQPEGTSTPGAVQPPETRVFPPESPGRRPEVPPAASRPSERREISPEAVRPGPAVSPPEPRSAPQESLRRAPKESSGPSRPPESRVIQPGQLQPPQQVQPPAPRPTENRVVPPEQRRTPQPQSDRSPGARPAAPGPQTVPPEPRAAPPQPQAQPAPAPPSKGEPRPDKKRDDKKEKDKPD